MKSLAVVSTIVVMGVVLCVASAQEANAPAEPKTTAGKIRFGSTIHCVGIEWDIAGDSNHNAACSVQYRKKGAQEWKPAMALLRIDSNVKSRYGNSDRPYNMLAGSIFFLDPGTTYEVRLDLADPDGGSKRETIEVRTWDMPRFPKGGRTFHVKPGNGGGDGSAADPFLGIAAAQKAARPGDTMLLHAGDYGRVDLNKPGKRGRHIVWRAAGDGEAVIRHLNVTSWLWIDGLFFRRDVKAKVVPEIGSPEKALVTPWGDTVGVYVTRCVFRDYHYSIWPSERMTRYRGAEWYIADNDIIGNKYGPLDDNRWAAGEGIELEHGSDNVVCYNVIRNVADGVSYPHRNCDIYNNLIYKTTDDGIETDSGYANVRVWRNRIYDVGNYSFSFQAQLCGPWYFIRNQVDKGYKHFVPLKWYSIHNTTVPAPFRRKKTAPECISINDISRDVPDTFTTTDATRAMTLKPECAAIDAGQVLPNVNDPFVKDGKPDLGAYEFGQPLPQVGPRSKEFLEKLYGG